MKNSIVAATVFLSLCLCAADFWQVKPFTEWNDKDVHKMIENSPWAKPYSLANTPPSSNGGGRRGGGMPATDAPMTDISQSGLGGGGGGRNRGENNDDMAGPAPATLLIRWQTALPVKEALLRLQYGSEAAASPEAKKILDNRDDIYVINVRGVTQNLLQGVPVQVKRDLLEHTYLSTKGKDDLHPSDVQFKPSQVVDLFFLFPRKTPFTLDDKEIEFSTKLGTLIIKQRFRLKDMVINGKLEL